MSEIKLLIIKHLRGELTPEEQAGLLAWLNAAPENRALFDRVNDPDWVGKVLARMDQVQDEEAWHRLQSLLRHGVAGSPESIADPGNRSWLRYAAAAAAIVMLLGVGTWFFTRSGQRSNAADPSTATVNEVLPGGNKAILTLSGGRQIVLDSAHNGQLAQQGSSSIIMQDGHVTYHATGAGEAVLYNTMTTPRGGQYQLTLPDGTKVWLNAASSLKYPTAFTGQKREVELTGEAYFEVMKNGLQPFVVNTNKAQVRVLGTHFNVMAYEDEAALKATLLEGSVEVSKGSQTRLLAPGQEASVSGNEPIALEKEADIDKAIAWKTGFFKFNDTDIRALMREIARWYDIDISYEINDYSDKYGGRISRNFTLSKLIGVLEHYKIHHYKIEGRKLIVLP